MDETTENMTNPEAQTEESRDDSYDAIVERMARSQIAGQYVPSSRDIRAQCLHTVCEHMARHMPGVTAEKIVETAGLFARFIDNGLPPDMEE